MQKDGNQLFVRTVGAAAGLSGYGVRAYLAVYLSISEDLDV